MATYLLDCDLTGGGSVQHLIDAGNVKIFPIRSEESYITVCDLLLQSATPNDLIVVDTVSILAENIRDEIVTKCGKFERADTLEDQHKRTMTAYGDAQRTIMRRLRNLRNSGLRLVTTFHERDQKDLNDVTIKKRGPAVNEAFFTSIAGSSTDVFRMTRVTEPILDAEGKVRFPEGTRFLQLKDSSESVAKYQVPISKADSIPKLLSNPTLPKLYGILGKRPLWLSIYGPMGVGKTTLACSDAETK